MSTTTGCCLCGDVKFRIDAELAPIQLCYCEQCRKAQGGPLVAVIPVETSSFHWVQGEHALKSFVSSPGKERVFCGRCGSPVFSRRSDLPGVLRLRAGLLDEPVTARAAFHAQVASKCSWWRIEDELPQHARGVVLPAV